MKTISYFISDRANSDDFQLITRKEYKRLRAMEEVYRATERVVSKAMITCTDYHDEAAWLALKAALEEVRENKN